MYLRIVLLLLPLMWEWQVAVADCDKTCYDYQGTYREPCRNRTEIDGIVEREGGGQDITIVQCDEDIVFSGSRRRYELPDGVTDIVITNLSISAKVRLLIGRLICSFHYECFTMTLTSEAKPSIVIRLKVSVFKIQAFGLEFGFASLTFRAVCERKCAKMKMPDNNRLMKRIVNGDVVQVPHTYVFMARLNVYYSSVDINYSEVSASSVMSSYDIVSECGGSIIHEYWILTAAHCVPSTSMVGTTTVYLMGVNVFLGDHCTNVTETEERTRWVTPQNVYLHANYNQPTTHNNDIALLKIASIEPNKDFRFPICLAPPYMDKLSFLDDCDVISAGWGVFNAIQEDVSSVYLREGFFTVENNAVCAAKYLAVAQPETITDEMICSTDDITNVCYGDSGGPVFCKDRYNTFLQVGVNSFNEPDPVTLWRHNFPQVGARVTRYIGWINGIIAPDVLP